MKRIMFSFFFALLVLVGITTAYGESNVVGETGIKVWANTWSREVPGTARAGSDWAWLIGPEVSTLVNNRLLIDAAYLFSASDYSFRSNAASSEADRQDAEVAFAYLFVPGFGLSAGYRAVWIREKGTGLEETLYGPTVGIRGNTSFTAREFSFLGRLDYQFTKFKQEEAGVTFRENSPGWIAEFGFKYAFSPVFSGGLGYKYEMNKGKDSDARDTFHGPTVTASFFF